MTMLLKRNFLWIIFFGSLIGLNETLIGSFSFPYRSVTLSSITIIILSLARLKISKKGTSILIMLIAILFKINSSGVHSCTTNMLLCGPTALFLIGIAYEIFASLFISKKSFKYLNLILTCSATSIIAFSMFALMNTYIISVWDTSRLLEYILLKATLTAIISSAASILGLYLVRIFEKEIFLRLNPLLINSILSVVIIAFWLFGSFV